MTIPLLRPSCSDDEIQAVTEVLRSGWWGQGPKCEEFEKRIAKMHGYPYAATTNSATSALHLALLANNIGPGDEVIVPALTFISTALAVTYTGATPVFADVYPDTLTLDHDSVSDKITHKTQMIIPVDYAGYPACRDEDWQMPVLQDAAHHFGGEMYGDEVAFSFHPVKNLATGDGGAILMSDPVKYERIKALRWCGINKSTYDRTVKQYGWDYDIRSVGYKCHWNDIQAAIGLTQLNRWDDLVSRRRTIAGWYTELLEGLPVTLPVDHPNHTWHLYAVRVDAEKRDKIIDAMLAAGISVGVHYKPLTHYPMYAGAELPVTEREWRRLISLPIFYDLKHEQVVIIANEFIKAVRNA